MAKKISRNPNDFEAIVVNGCLIEPGTIYEIVAKEPPEHTPPIYQELGSTKERMPGVSNTVTLTQSNTGFFSASPTFNKYDAHIKNNWTERERLSNKFYEVFAEPVKMYISEIERIKVPTDDEFFDKNYEKGFFTANVGEGIQFNTDNPIDRFKLYIAIWEGDLSMKGKRTDEEKEIGLKDENDMFNQDSQYSYISMNEKKNKTQQQAEAEMEASYRFGQMLREDKDTLVGILNYINIQASKDTPRAELNTVFKSKIEVDKKKLKEFIEMIEKFDDNSRLLTIEFELLDKLKSKKGREILVKEGSSYYFNDVVLGSNLKSVVSTLLKPENEVLLKEFYHNFS